MQPRVVPEIQRSLLSEFIAERMGLHFPSERWGDLQRGLAGAAEEFGFEDAAACADWLVSEPLTKTRIQVLASHLTVGETYFFREKKTFEALAASVVPDLVRSRRGCGRRLRIWSAACCTGEEAYSLAILLHQIIPDLADWHVTILATDINERFLQKAATGVYGEWSFRESPAWFKERYFQRTANGRHAIVPEIKKLVTFMHLNLAEDVYPSLASDTNGMDVIFCRNVLMYFTPTQARKAAGNLRRALAEDGWLAVSPSEGSQALCSGFVPVNFPGAILYQKDHAKIRSEPTGKPTPFHEATPLTSPLLEARWSWTPQMPAGLPMEPPPAWPMEEPVQAEPPLTPCAAATSLFAQGRYAEAVETLLRSFTEHDAPNPPALSLLARALANQGKLAEARAWCDRWVAADKLDASGHYLRAIVLQEMGDNEQARGSFQRAIYLQPDFVLAHFALGNLACGHRKSEEAEKHFGNAFHLLRGRQPDDLLPESDGLTAGRLTEIISSIVARETMR